MEGCKRTMLEQLKELLEMQRELDNAILKEHGNVYDRNIAEKNKIALLVELGEMMNELPTYFKHWKFTAENNREKALVEYVDALKFELSLFNYYKETVEYMNEYDNYGKLIKSTLKLSEVLLTCIICLSESEVKLSLEWLFNIGNYLGFTWEEIYKAYKAKNAVNYERLKNGY